MSIMFSCLFSRIYDLVLKEASLLIVVNMPRETQLQMITQDLIDITHQLVDPSARMESNAPRG